MNHDPLADITETMNRLARQLEYLDSELVLMRARGQKAEADKLEYRVITALRVLGGWVVMTDQPGGEP